MASEIETELFNLKKDELRALALAIDPVQFAITLGINPDPWQQELLLTEEKRVILNCSRQSGKSTLAAIIALHHALHDPAELVLVDLAVAVPVGLFDHFGELHKTGMIRAQSIRYEMRFSSLSG